MNDTSPEMAEKMREMIRAKSPSERARMGWSMYLTSKYLVTRAILEENPNISKSDLKKELFLRFYGNEFDEEARKKIFAYFDAKNSE
jgi:hypothetical protein